LLTYIILYIRDYASTCSQSQHLRRRHRLESLCNLLLPPESRLSINLSRRLQPRAETALVKQDGAQHNLVGAERFLLVVDVGGAVLAVVLQSR
jgi:hypothetical protein